MQNEFYVEKGSLCTTRIWVVLFILYKCTDTEMTTHTHTPMHSRIHPPSHSYSRWFACWLTAASTGENIDDSNEMKMQHIILFLKLHMRLTRQHTKNPKTNQRPLNFHSLIFRTEKTYSIYISSFLFSANGKEVAFFQQLRK